MIKNDISLFTIDNIISVLDKKKYQFFNTPDKPYNLNIIGVRDDTNDVQYDKFNDTLIVLYNNEGRYVIDYFDITTDPSTQYLYTKPINNLGTAVLIPNQYIGLWKLGMHQGKFPALVQKNPCVVSRDYNKDNKLDYKKPKYTNSKRTNMKDGSILFEYFDVNNNLVFREHKGMFGINLHRANKYKVMELIGFHSAGCQVFKDIKDNDRFLDFYVSNALRYFENSFTYTLLLKSDFINLNK